MAYEAGAPGLDGLGDRNPDRRSAEIGLATPI